MANDENYEAQNPPNITLAEVSEDGRYGKFVCEPLRSGYGITIGNSLRRMLLSSLEGVALTSVKFDGIFHEFSTLDGVYEDVTNIILNLKQLHLRIDEQSASSDLIKFDNSYKLYIDVNVKEEIKNGKHLKGIRDVTAADISCDSSIKIVNPRLHIARLNEKGKLKIEMIAKRGWGYVQAEDNRSPEDAIGTIPMDSIFSPVVRVNYEIQDTRVGSKLDFDKLILEVCTNGALRPEEAVAKASEILTTHLKLFQELECVPKNETISPFIEEDVDEIDSNHNIAIEELDLSPRSFNCLKRSGINKVNDLIAMTKTEIMNVRNLGQKSFDEIKNKLSELGLSFKPDVDDVISTKKNPMKRRGSNEL